MSLKLVPSPHEPSSSSVSSLDVWHRDLTTKLREIQPNRMIHVDAIVTNNGKNDSNTSSSSSSKVVPRYSLWVLDVDGSSSSSSPNAVILILPQGREGEWKFRSLKGGSELAQQYGLQRITFVSLNRGQQFTNLEQVKSELQPLLRIFQPTKMSGKMNIVSIGSDVGARREVYRTESHITSSSSSMIDPSLNESLVVEDVQVDEFVHRRLIFGASGIVQTEARLNVTPAYLTMTAAQRKAKEKKRKANAKKKAAAAAAGSKDSATAADGDDGDDGVEEAELSAAAGSSSTAASSSFAAPSCAPSPSASLIQYNYLPAKYSHGFLAMLSLLPRSPESMVLIGLGGGSLSMFLHLSRPTLHLHAIELDPIVVESAWKFFGFRQDTSKEQRLICHTTDGLEFIEKMAARISEKSTASDDNTNTVGESYPPLPSTPQDVVIIDVNNSDLSQDLSFPPPSFLTPNFLQSIRHTLKSDGWFILNLGCRTEMLRESILQTLQQEFNCIFTIHPDEEYLNMIVGATNRNINDGDNGDSEFEWSHVVERLLASQTPVTPILHQRSGFQWDKMMAEDVREVLKKTKRLVHDKQAGAVQLKYAFPAQRAEQEKNDK